jgi:hypothetical protein
MFNGSLRGGREFFLGWHVLRNGTVRIKHIHANYSAFLD